VDLYTADSLPSFADRIAKLSAAASPNPLWFRGVSDAGHSLTPSLFRHPKMRDIEDLLALEGRLLSRFRQRSVPFLSASPPTDRSLTELWEYLFLMQHYGVPTRLLDWSENAFVALWFALSRQAQHPGATPAVWVIDPRILNQEVFSHQKYDKGVFSVGDVQLTGYGPNAEANSMNAAPVALYGTHNSPRIVAQRGVFTIAGKDIRSLEEFTNEFKSGRTCISRIDVPPDRVEQLTMELRGAGFTESMIFPDLEGLARELKSTEGF
jgi:FRG domain